MAVFQGTPGPWAAEVRAQCVAVFGPSLGRETIDPFTGQKGVSGPELICRVSAGPGLPAGVGAANARLVTAAPELFAELAGLLRCFDRDNVPARKVDGPAGPGVRVTIRHKQAARLRELLARITREG